MMRVPMLDLKREYEYMKEDIDAAIKGCLKHQQWILGPEVSKFEEAVAQYLGVRHCIGVSSGTDALVLALRALAIKTKGQEYFDRSDLIITTPFTFTATGDSILRAGATPVFVDIDPLTYNIDPSSVREYLSSSAAQSSHRSARVVGILPVHLYGQACQMDEIMSIAEGNDLFVVEDAAQAFGGSWNRRKLGSIGTCGAFSFFPSKNLGGFGDGGMVSTHDDEIAELIRMLLKHGGKDKYNVEHVGYNARLDTLQAAILLTKLRCVDKLKARRARIASLYSNGLRDTKGLILPSPGTSGHVAQDIMEHVFHQYTIRALNHQRDSLQRYLKKYGIESGVYYPTPLHKMKVFERRHRIHGKLNEAELAAKEVLSLPIEPLMEAPASSYVAATVKAFFSNVLGN